MASDFTQSSKKILVDLINEDNPGHGFTEAILEFGLPTAAPGGSPARNTQVTVSAAADSGYSGSVDVLYNRVDMALIPGTNPTVFPAGNATNVSDLIPEINARYHINLGATDYVDAALPPFTGEPNEDLQFQVTASSDSLVWFGNLILIVTANDIPLNTVITTTTLNGLNYVPYEAP